MTPGLLLRVVTPSSVLLEVADAAWVQVQLADGGGIGIWPGHGPLLAESVAGEVRFDAGGERAQQVAAGILAIRDDTVTIWTIDPTPAAIASRDGSQDDKPMRLDRLARALYDRLSAAPDQEQG